MYLCGNPTNAAGKCLVFGIFCLVFSVLCLVFGVWCLVFGKKDITLDHQCKTQKTKN
jgi:hypothetical protein